MLVLRTGQTDSLLILWTTLGLYGLLRHLTAGPAWGWYAVASVAMGLGVMTKGVGIPAALPPGAVRLRTPPRLPASRADPGQGSALVARRALPARHRRGVARAAAWPRGELRGSRRSRLPPEPPLHRRPPSAWFRRGSIASRSGTSSSRSSRCYWLPLVAGLPWLVPAWRRRLLRGDGRVLLLIGWVVLVVTFFSLSSGKRSLYVFPAVPALALAAAPVVAGCLRPARQDPRTPSVSSTRRGRRLVRRDDRMGRRGAVRARGRLPSPSGHGGGRAPDRHGAGAGAHPLARRTVALRAESDRALRIPRGCGSGRAGPDVAPGGTGSVAARRRSVAPRLLRHAAAPSTSARIGSDSSILVEPRMDPGRCPPAPLRRLYRFRWKRPFE